MGARTNANPLTVNIATSSESPEITPDGRYVVFYSTATNLVAGVKTAGEIYVARSGCREHDLGQHQRAGHFSNQ